MVAGEDIVDYPSLEVVASLMVAGPSFDLATLVMRAQYLGLPNLPLEDVCGPVYLCVAWDAAWSQSSNG